MLKDITLGQFFPGNSLVHRLDPRTKLICVVLYIAALFSAGGWAGYALVLTVLVASVAVSHIGGKALLRGMKPVVVILIFTGILNLLYDQSGTELLHLGFLHVTTGGLQRAFFMISRILMLISGTFLLTYTTSPIALTDGLEHLLSPLKLLKVPVHDLAMMMSIALRFIPTLIEETDKIMSAQKARGADFDGGSLLDKAKAMVPLMVPLFVSAFRRADELATAMECRCYHGGEGRTRLNQLRFQGADYAVLALFLALLGAVLALKWNFDL